MPDIAILGAGLAGNLAAAYLRQRLPALDVAVVAKTGKSPPIVGESIVEYGARFLHEIGMGVALEEKQYHKYGLSFYYKERLDRPDCRRYAVHESPGVPRLPAYQVNRATFDPELREHNRRLGVQFLDGTVTGVELASGGSDRHAVTYRGPDGETHELEARWLIDATGRARYLGRRLGVSRPEMGPQRSAFWFRLADFDADTLGRLEAIKQQHHCFDPYYATHHFFGRGNWIWLIPMRSDQPRGLISIGIVYRPDLFGRKVTDIEGFLDAVEREHPVVAELVRSGRVVDTNAYLSYQYESSRYYSPDGWFLLGDAGMTFDPLFSFGISMAAVQVTQIAAIIKKDLDGELEPNYVDALDRMIAVSRRVREDNVGRLYEFMDQPLRLAWTLQIMTAGWFHAELPFFLTGVYTESNYAPILTERGGTDSLEQLLEHVSKRSPQLPATALENHMGEAVNWRLFRSRTDDIPGYLGRLQLVRAGFRWQLLKMAGPGMAAKHAVLCAGDLWRALTLWSLARTQLARSRRRPTQPFSFDDPFLVGSTPP